MESYVNAVCSEIKMRGKEHGKFYDVTSIYIGGGSPSVLKEGMVAKILTEIKNNFRVSEH
jgi:coproporphyrinogen III oxidase-like Fe-S oxidoreductase